MISCRLSSLIGIAFFVIHQVLAQETVSLTDPVTGFKFSGAQSVFNSPTANGALSFGVAFPKNLDKDDYIGYLTSARPAAKGAGWTGISHTTSMSKSLLLVIWPEGNNVITSFRYAKAYDAPVSYTGKDATLTQLSHTVNTTHFTLTYRCQKCTTWDQGGEKGNQSMKGEDFFFGWAQGRKAPAEPKVPTSRIDFHDLGFGVLPIQTKVVASASYDSMVAAVPKKVVRRGEKMSFVPV